MKFRRSIGHRRYEDFRIDALTDSANSIRVESRYGFRPASGNFHSLRVDRRRVRTAGNGRPVIEALQRFRGKRNVYMYLDPSLAREAPSRRNSYPVGLAKLTRLAFAGVDLGPIARQLLGMFERDPDHAGALMDLSVIDQLNGRLETGLTRQSLALRKQRVFHSTCCGARPNLRMLAFVAPADIGSNTPLEFLLEGSDVALTTVHVLPGRPLPENVPDHDLAFVAVARTESNRAVLNELERALEWWPAPVVNPPDLISALAREKLFAKHQSTPGLRIPPEVSMRRADLDRPEGSKKLRDFIERWGVPFVIKPLLSHAGDGLAKIEHEDELRSYLTVRLEDRFSISPFVDYRSPDGQFRKFRIVLIDGRPYACHMSVADDWNTQYFESRMELSTAKRAEEACFFARFDDDFCIRHGAALTTLAASVGLEYFGVDCAELPSGELVIFKADHTMLVHDMDPVDVFPYKPAQMRKIFHAFSAFSYEKANEARPVGRRRRARL